MPLRLAAQTHFFHLFLFIYFIFFTVLVASRSPRCWLHLRPDLLVFTDPSVDLG